MKIAQERLYEILDYDSETGIFTWKIGRRKCKKDSIAGSLTGEGYWQIKIDNKLYLSHRLVFLYVDGYLPENKIDHIDRNKLNNRRNNLREVSQTCNTRNCNIYKNKAVRLFRFKQSNGWSPSVLRY